MDHVTIQEDYNVAAIYNLSERIHECEIKKYIDIKFHHMIKPS